ncbi:hypothetical protein AWI74_14435 [Listeria monocytogenes]|nr:hypothetical protein AWI74_14435 [Listeria monocytogenes]
MFWTTTIFAGMTVQAVGGEIPFWGLVLFLAVIMGLYWTVHPARTHPFFPQITGNDNLAL